MNYYDKIDWHIIGLIFLKLRLTFSSDCFHGKNVLARELPRIPGDPN